MSYETQKPDSESSAVSGLAVREGSNHTKMTVQDQIVAELESDQGGDPAQGNVFRRHIKEDPNKIKYAKHKLWLDSLQHEYPMPYVKYRVGVYIRFFNQTKYSDEVYLEKHKAQFREDVACCPLWNLVDFYVDQGSAAPSMEYSKEWLRLLDDCFAGKVNLIVTQKVSNVSSDPGEIAFVARILANQKPPVGIYFISEDIFTLGSYYWADMKDEGFVAPGWKSLPPDDLDLLPPATSIPLPEGNNKGTAVDPDAAGEVM